MLYVDASNVPAVKLYIGLGFAVNHIDRGLHGRRAAQGARLLVVVLDRRMPGTKLEVGRHFHALAPDRAADDLGEVDPVPVLAGDEADLFEQALGEASWA